MEKNVIGKWLGRYALTVLLCLLVLCVLVPAKAEAAESLNVTVKQYPDSGYCIATWTSVSGASSYTVWLKEKIGDTYYQIGTARGVNTDNGDIAAVYFQLSDFTDVSGWYETQEDDFIVEVAAYNKADTEIARGKSASFTPGIPQLAAPSNVRITADGIVRWSKVSNAQQYRIILYSYDSGWTQVTQKTVTGSSTQECNFSDSVVLNGKYKASVQAGASGYRYSKRTESDSITVDANKLNVYERYYDANETWVASWNPVAGASYYGVYLMEKMAGESSTYHQVGVGKRVEAGETLSMDFPLSAFTDYKAAWFIDPQDDYVFDVVAFNAKGDRFAKGSSVSFTGGTPQLSAPNAVTLYDRGDVNWDSVNNAEEYRVTLYRYNGTEWIEVKYKIVNTQKCSFTENVVLDGKYKVSVLAGATGYRYSKLTESEAVTSKDIAAVSYKEDIWTIKWHPFANTLYYNIEFWQQSGPAVSWTLKPFYLTNAKRLDYDNNTYDETAICAAPFDSSIFSNDYLWENDPLDSFRVAISALDENGKIIAVIRSGEFASGLEILKAPTNVKLDGEGKATWNAVSGAKKYKVVLYRYHSGWEEVISKTVSAASADFKAYCESGVDYKVSVMAINDDRISSKTVSSNSCVYHQVLSAAATLKGPQTGRQASCYVGDVKLTTDPAAALDKIGQLTWCYRDSESSSWKIMKDTDYFVEGRYYAAEILALLKKGVNGYVVGDDTVATLNGKPADCSDSSDECLYIWYDFGKLTCPEQPYIDIILKEPKYGDTKPDLKDVSISWRYGAEQDIDLEMDHYGWDWKWYTTDDEDEWRTMDDTDTYQCNAFYRLSMDFDLYGTRLKSDGNIYVNGKAVPLEDLEIRNDGQTIYFEYIWRTGTPIKRVSAHISPPSAGKALPTEKDVTIYAYTDNDKQVDGIKADLVEWDYKTSKNGKYTDVGNETVFVDGRYYRVWIVFCTSRPDCYLSEDVVAYLNGMKYSEVDPFYEDEGSGIMYRVFSELAPAPPPDSIPSLSFTVTEPADGALPSTVILSGADSEYATAVLSWSKSLSTKDVSMKEGERFKYGVEYRPIIEVTPKSGYQITDDTVITINGKSAIIYIHKTYPDGTKGYYIRTYVPNTDYNVWVEGKQISTSNRNDVLQDGGSVKLLTKAETGDEMTLVLTNAVLNQLNSKSYKREGLNEYSKAVIYTEEQLNIRLVGSSTIGTSTRTGSSGGIALCGMAINLEFEGEGSLYIDCGEDYVAIDVRGHRLIFGDSVNVTAKGKIGIDGTYNGTDDEMVSIRDTAEVYAYAYQSENVDRPAIITPDLYVDDMGTLTAESEGNGQAIDTWDSVFSSPEYTIKALRNDIRTGKYTGEYVKYGIQPYEIEGINRASAGYDEEQLRYVYINRPEHRVQGLSLSKTSLTFTKLNTNEYIRPIFTPTYATYPGVTWSSSDESVATVSNGHVYPVSNGTATITAVSTDGGYKAYCTVTVKVPIDYTLKDVSKLFRWWNGKETLTDIERKNLNADGNTVTDLRDAAAIYRKVSG